MKTIRPLMGNTHRAAILHSIPTGGTMLEWGCGGTTHWLRAHLTKKQTLVSIEHNPVWARRIGGVILHKLDIATGCKGAEIYPYDQNDRAFDYVRAHGVEFDSFDVILVDGVLRNQCLRAAVSMLKPDGVIFLHDAQRDWYEEGRSHLEWKPELPSCDDYPGPTLAIGGLPCLQL